MTGDGGFYFGMAVTNLQFNFYFLPCISYGFAVSAGCLYGKLPFLQHAVVCSFPCTDCKGAVGIVPTHRDFRIGTFLIVVIISLVLIKGKTSVGAGVYT